jgi:metal-responsive CopG/Arc/MetJ family transcriptional regulator
MKIIQLVLEAELLRAANGAAKRARVNRSAFIRQALREHLRRAGVREILT